MIARTRRSATALLLVHALVASACSAGHDPNAPPRRQRGVLQGPPVAASERPQAPAPPPEEAPHTPPPPPLEPPAAPVVAPAKDPEPRDYSAELVQALGNPLDCLAPRKGTAAPPKLEITFDAYVMPSGGVGRAYARSTDLDAGELDCLRRRVEALRLTPPIEGAPRQVHAGIQLTLKPAESQPK